MRQGNGNDGIVMNDVDECAGIHLRADYCAEHEWGIKDIRREFGIDADKIGIEKRRISNPGNVYLVEFTKNTEKCAFLTNALTYVDVISERSQGKWEDFKNYVSDYRWFDLKRNELSQGVAGAWDSKHFIVVVKGNENIDMLKELYNAFQKNDVAIFLGGGGNGPFQNYGLSIAIISQLPNEIIQDMKNVDMHKINLEKAADKTGIAKKLKKAGLGYYALSPEWNDPDNPSEGVKFWLNPTEQHKYNHGWYTVDELKEWIKGKGPILK